MKRPKSLNLSESFPYKQELVAALDDGERCQRLDKAGELLAGELAGTYQIRLNIAKDPTVRGKSVPEDDLAVRDLTVLADRLSAAAPESVLACYSIGPTKNGFKYQLLEHESDGRFIGCVRGPYPDEA